jgi:hypothetical protein
MVRLLLVSIGIMMVGLMAVLGAIVYKIGEAPDATVAAAGGMEIAPGTTGIVDLPPDAEVVSATLDGDNVMLQLRLAGGGRELVIHSLSRNRIVARLSLE